MTNKQLTWDEIVAQQIELGAKSHQPNGLPLRSIHADGSMYEHEHGDHRDYMFPVDVEFTGPLTAEHQSDFEMIAERPAVDEKELRDFYTETHALIYTDGSIALTLYECNYAQFSVGRGIALGGRYVSDHKLSRESMEKIWALNRVRHVK